MDNGEARRELVEQLNGAVANIASARARLQKAKSELGTAEAELAQRAAEYEKYRSRLLQLLPSEVET